MKRKIFKIFSGLLILLAVAYAGDFAVLQFRIAKNLNPYGTVLVRSYYAISKKAPGDERRVEYDFAGTDTVTCTHSLFPQRGYTPCWYANSHTEKRIDI